MNELDEIKSLCNYSVSKSTQLPYGNICYIDFDTTSREDELQNIKAYNRDLALDIITGDKKESEWDNRLIFDDNVMGSITPRVHSVNVTRVQYNNLYEVKKYLITTILNETTGPCNHFLKHGVMDVITLTQDSNLTNMENFDNNYRKTLLKIAQCNNYIGMNSRKGVGNTILAHPDSFIMDIYATKPESIENGTMRLILSKYVPIDKVIVLRTDDLSSAGFLFSHDEENKSYYASFVDTKLNNYMWFYIK